MWNHLRREPLHAERAVGPALHDHVGTRVQVQCACDIDRYIDQRLAVLAADRTDHQRPYRYAFVAKHGGSVSRVIGVVKGG